MTEHQPEHSSDQEHEDRLIDVGLRELLGGEAPPDLSEPILAAVKSQTSTVELADSSSNPSKASKAKSMRGWLIGVTTLAASIAIFSMLWMPASSSRLARRKSNRVDRKTVPESAEQYGAVVTDMSVPAQGGGEDAGTTIQPSNVNHSASGGLGGQASVELGQRVQLTPRLPGRNFGVPKGTVRGRSIAGGARPSVGRPWGYFEGGERAGSEPLLGKNVLVDAKGKRLLHSVAGDLAVAEQGIGPELSEDQYSRIVENPFMEAVGASAVSTFSIDVDTASYSNVRQFLMQSRTLPPPDAVRIEELINYFDYDYDGPTDNRPFAAHVEAASCPWNPEHQLVRVAVKGKEPVLDGPRPLSNLVFLVDVSGSMNQPNKLPLVVEGLRYLTRELSENDRVAIVVYASSEGLALPSTPGSDQQTILQSLDNLRAGGSTAGGAGITLAYQVAEQNFIKGGVNRVVLCTDGDFNVGTTSTAELERMAETKAKQTGTFLTVLGFGRGNLNDAMMETISNKGNGNYHYIDNQRKARKVLVEEMSGTLVTIAKDVKIQVEFNPAKVAGYRLIGYENRMLAREDFNDDTKDAGEIGAGHTVTALYEIIRSGQPVPRTKPDPLKYQNETEPNDAAISDELLTIRLRYKQPDGDTSTKIEFPVPSSDTEFKAATSDFRFASAVASFGMLLRGSEYAGGASFDTVLEILDMSDAAQRDEYRAEFVKLVKQARSLSELQ